MPTPHRLPLIAAFALPALLAVSTATRAQDAREDWPEGSAMHTAFVVSERLEAGRAALAEAHAGLLAALEEADGPSFLNDAVAAQQARWLAYRHADCELAGMLTGAGGAWPGVHALGCENEFVAKRLAAVDGARACLGQLAADSSRFERYECLEGLVDWSLGGY